MKERQEYQSGKVTKRRSISGDVNTCRGKNDETARHIQGRVKGSVLLNYKVRMVGAEVVSFQNH